LTWYDINGSDGSTTSFRGLASVLWGDYVVLIFGVIVTAIFWGIAIVIFRVTHASLCTLLRNLVHYMLPKIVSRILKPSSNAVSSSAENPSFLFDDSMWLWRYVPVDWTLEDEVAEMLVVRLVIEYVIRVICPVTI
jgi:hypothetical protein